MRPPFLPARKPRAKRHSSERNAAPRFQPPRPASLPETGSDQKSHRRSQMHSSPPSPPASTPAASASISASGYRSARLPHTGNQRPSPTVQTTPSRQQPVRPPPVGTIPSSPAAA